MLKEIFFVLPLEWYSTRSDWPGLCLFFCYQLPFVFINYPISPPPPTPLFFIEISFILPPPPLPSGLGLKQQGLTGHLVHSQSRKLVVQEGGGWCCSRRWGRCCRVVSYHIIRDIFGRIPHIFVWIWGFLLQTLFYYVHKLEQVSGRSRVVLLLVCKKGGYIISLFLSLLSISIELPNVKSVKRWQFAPFFISYLSLVLSRINWDFQPYFVLKNLTHQNMISPSEVDGQLEQETKDECSKYGRVERCMIFQVCFAHEGYYQAVMSICWSFRWQMDLSQSPKQSESSSSSRTEILPLKVRSGEICFFVFKIVFGVVYPPPLQLWRNWMAGSLEVDKWTHHITTNSALISWILPPRRSSVYGLLYVAVLLVNMKLFKLAECVSIPIILKAQVVDMLLNTINWKNKKKTLISEKRAEFLRLRHSLQSQWCQED